VVLVTTNVQPALEHRLLVIPVLMLQEKDLLVCVKLGSIISEQMLFVVLVTINVQPALDHRMLVIPVLMLQEKDLLACVKIHTIIAEQTLNVSLVLILVKTVPLLLIVLHVKPYQIDPVLLTVAVKISFMKQTLNVTLAYILVTTVRIATRNVPYVLLELREVKLHLLVVVTMVGIMLVQILTVLNAPTLVLNVKILAVNVLNAL
jgi:hypothetical protein